MKMSEPITTFSGAHPFRPACLLDALDYWHSGSLERDELADEAAELISIIDSERCPRCRGEYFDGEIPSGSRLTSCRCIPVCSQCGAVEWLGEYGAGEWPLSPELVTTEREHYRAHLSERGLLSPDGVLITDDGVGPVQPRPHPGGWAEYGYDESADGQERQG
jgi:hypothetical protein